MKRFIGIMLSLLFMTVMTASLVNAGVTDPPDYQEQLTEMHAEVGQSVLISIDLELFASQSVWLYLPMPESGLEVIEQDQESVATNYPKRRLPDIGRASEPRIGGAGGLSYMKLFSYNTLQRLSKSETAVNLETERDRGARGPKY